MCIFLTITIDGLFSKIHVVSISALYVDASQKIISVSEFKINQSVNLYQSIHMYGLHALCKTLDLLPEFYNFLISH